MAFGLEQAISPRPNGSLSGGLRDRAHDLNRRWTALSLYRRFTITAAVVISIGMVMLGTWVAARISHAVVQASAANAALYLTGFIEPHVKELATGDVLSAPSRQHIDQMFERIVGQSKVVGIKIWARGGKLAYSSDKLRIGSVFAESKHLLLAWAGSIEAEYNNLSDPESEMERRLGLPLLEIYTPIRDLKTNEIIAVAEIYEIAERLQNDLRSAFLQSVLVVGSLALVMIGALFHIVSRGSDTIDSQRAALAERVDDLSRLLLEKRQLQRRIALANRRAVETNEEVMRRVGAELHDGPAQSIGFALLRLDAIRPQLAASAAGSDAPDVRGNARDTKDRRGDIELIRSALQDGLKELRAVCSGLSIPELVGATLPHVLKTAVRNHEFRTRTDVELVLAEGLPTTLDMPLATCVYRLVQEGLNNAYRHGNASDQKVEAEVIGDRLRLVVSDTGGGLKDVVRDQASLGGLGLRGLRNRIVSLGGDFEVVSKVDSGVTLIASFCIDGLGGTNE